MDILLGDTFAVFSDCYRIPFVIYDELCEGLADPWVEGKGKSINRGVDNTELSLCNIPVFGCNFKGFDC